MVKHKVKRIREAVGIFVDEDTLAEVIFDLETHGFERRHLSVLANKELVKAKLGKRYQSLEDLEDNPKTPRSFFIPKETIGIGQGVLISVPCLLTALIAAAAMVELEKSTLVTVLAAIAASIVGGLIGLVLAKLLYEHHVDYIQEQLDQGGLVLWVTLENEEQEKIALEIMNKHFAYDVHVHEIPNYTTM